ncbi:hypothetical protein BaRGS_00025186 [Batillaria attramentaria]|uniref:AAA+ ATPase domain-containing protein n=1 Tax=Batillaria attramentaria TaxID=370345 RepID=A0ABD0K8Y5_9CAEN
MNGKEKVPYISDPSLVPRIRNYLHGEAADSYTDAQTVMTYLQETYSFGCGAERHAERPTVWEAGHRVTAAWLKETKDQNAVNTSLRKIYVRSSASQSPVTFHSQTPDQGKQKTKKTHLQREASSVTDNTPSDLSQGWFIDRNGSGKDSADSGNNEIARASDVPETPDPGRFPSNSGDGEQVSKEGTKKDELSYQLEEFFRPEIYREVDISPPRGFLLHGPPGCGKTLLANCIAGHLSVPFLKVGSTELVSGVSGDSEQKIRDLFEQAVTAAPCVIFIDEIDCIAPKRENASKDMERRIVTQLMLCMDELNTKSESILVLGATNRPDAIDPALRVPGRFDIEISLGIPDQKAREAILCKLCQKMRLSSDFDFKTVARACPGYVGGDLVALKRQAGLLAVKRCSRLSKHHHSSSDTLQNSSVTSSGPWVAPMVPDKLSETEKKPLTEEEIEALTITPDDFMEALKKVQPSAKREGFATVPDVTWDDVGALGDVREVLNTAILGPVRYPEMCESFGLEGASGVLLVGPPGCGKTLVAKAVANESGINFISVKGPELMNMYVGESERAVRQVFQRARNSSPCVIFFDELDSLCPRRSDHENQSSARVVNQLLTEMDGLETRKQVYIMAATNRADIIDPAVLRPGRLDKIVHVGMPGAHDRYEILLTITKNGTKPCLDTDVDLKDIAESSQCNGFSGADLAALVREAATMAMKEMLKNPGQAASERRVVTRAHFDHALTVVRPSVSRLTQESYKRAADKAW